MNSARQQGFTLVELMLALAIGSVVVYVIYLAFTAQQRSWVAQEQVAEMQQNMRSGLQLLSNELMTVGYDPPGTANAGFVSATANSVRFTMNITDNSGVTGPTVTPDNDTGDVGEDITYKLNSDNELCRIDHNLSDSADDCDAIAEGVERIEFRYILENGNIPPAGQIGLIRSVQISMLARSNTIMLGPVVQQTFTSASGENWTPTTNDQRRRMFVSMTVQCRNLKLQ